MSRNVERALAQMPHVELHRLPSSSPHLNVVERLWKLLRQQATHNQLYDDVAALQAARRKHLDWLQVHLAHVRSLIGAEA